MHAWSEVEHDLVYKPLQGTLSDEELAILDELNGLVLAGEIALGACRTRAMSAYGTKMQSSVPSTSWLPTCIIISATTSVPRT